MLNLIAIACVADFPSLGSSKPVLHLLSDKGTRTNIQVSVTTSIKSLGKRLRSLQPKQRYILVGTQEAEGFNVQSFDTAVSR